MEEEYVQAFGRAAWERQRPQTEAQFRRIAKFEASEALRKAEYDLQQARRAPNVPAYIRDRVMLILDLLEPDETYLEDSASALWRKGTPPGMPPLPTGFLFITDHRLIFLNERTGARTSITWAVMRSVHATKSPLNGVLHVELNGGKRLRFNTNRPFLKTNLPLMQSHLSRHRGDEKGTVQ